MQALPIDAVLGDVKTAYAKSLNLIVTATPGAGKTTRIAPALMNAGLIPAGKKILMLQPRRIAAKAVAARIAEENNWKLGGSEVGYQVRFERCFEKNTALVIMTEGILARRLIDDPELKDVACVVLDEFHERSVHTDLSLALLKELQSALRPDLHVIVMSATLESATLEKYLPGSHVVRAQGQVHPLGIIHQPKADRRDYAKRLEDQVADAISFLLAREDDDRGNILVFLPGTGEIRRSANRLGDLTSLKAFEILQLHGSLSLDEQSRVLRTGPKRRIILSTNVAETSLTVPGVSTVVDSGLAKIVRWDPAKNFEKIELSRISLASVKQRSGRAAREKAGRVYRLWSQDDELRFKAYEDPEIARIDPSASLLTLAAWGVRDFETFDWFEKPSAARFAVSLALLKTLGAIDDKKQLTSRGREMQKIPVPPRLARALLEAKAAGREREMSFALALLEGKDPVSNPHKFKERSQRERECDLESRVVALMAIDDGEAAAQWGFDANISTRCARVAKDFINIARGFATRPAPATSESVNLATLLWSSYSDRLCRRRADDSNRALMVGGQGVQLSAESEVERSEFFLALELIDINAAKESKVLRATSLTRAELFRLAGSEIRDEVRSEVDLKTFKIKQSRQLRFRDLVIEGPYPVTRKDNPDAENSYGGLSEWILENWADFVRRFDDLKEFELRLDYLQKYCPELEVVQISDEIKSSLAEAVIEHAKNNSIDSLEFAPLLRSFYPHRELQVIDANAPTSILVPSGRHIKLHYAEDLETVRCKVKLQELFGLAASPSILRGKVQIIFDLLSPAQEPVQSTKDLASFWHKIYPEVRRELKIRYPRHPWPEDPWTAQATHKTKPRTRR